MEDCQDTISKLKFLSRIGKGHKVNVNLLSLQDAGMMTSLSRSVWNTDNRQNAITFIQNTINTSINLIFKFSKSDRPSEKIIAKEMIKDLMNSKTGINNLKTAYNTDIMFCCSIDTFIQNIDAKLQEYQTNLPELFTDSSSQETKSHQQ